MKEKLRDIEYIKYLLKTTDRNVIDNLYSKAREVSLSVFGNKIYVRGLIEFTNYCKNGCYYCGINRSNINADRYRLNKEQILECCNIADNLGIKTFVLQGGEDPYYTDDIICDIVKSIKKEYPNNAITLSIGEKEYESYKRYYEAGADRYLLRHETSSEYHYSRLHPEEMKLSHRLKCLDNLKEIGFQTGCGIMIGSPFQTVDNIAEDIIFMHNFKPHMIGIGPFIAHKDTIFKNKPNGTVDMTLRVLAILRLLMPNVLLPATTALGTLDEMGREKGIMAGANVLMPNMTPQFVRTKYSLYDNKICTGEEAAEGYSLLKERIAKIGYELVSGRGDYRTL